jgi:hypothetical protein
VAPAGRHIQIAGGGLELAAARAGDGADRAQLGPQRAGADAGDGLLTIEQRGHLPAQRGRGAQCLASYGQRDARPVVAQRAGVLDAVGRGVQHGDGVVEQLLLAERQAGEVDTGLVAQVGLEVGGIVKIEKEDALILEIRRDAARASISSRLVLTPGNEVGNSSGSSGQDV